VPTRKHIRWPRGLRIHSENAPLIELPDSHIAKLTVIAHAECWRDCVGQELSWPGRESEAFDQEWRSILLDGPFSFSSYAYSFIAFDLILHEWLTHPAFVTEPEKNAIVAVPLLDALLDECECAANAEQNARVLDRILRIRGFNNLQIEAIKARWATDGLEPPQIPDQPGVLEALRLRSSGNRLILGEGTKRPSP